MSFIGAAQWCGVSFKGLMLLLQYGFNNVRQRPEVKEHF